MKRKRIKGLPYWPSQKFLDDALALLKERGDKGNDEELRGKITKAYQAKRKEIIEEMTITKL